MFGRSMLPAITHYMLPFLASWPAQRAYLKKQTNNAKFRFPCQLAVSNVPGPREPLESEGATLEALWPMLASDQAD